MFATVLALTLACVGLTLLGVRATFRKLGLDPMQALLWLGLAELPPVAPPRARRR